MRTALALCSILLLCLFAPGCGGGSGGGGDPAASDYYIVTMVQNWTPTLDTTPLNSRKDMLARYDQAVGATRQKIGDFLGDMGFPDLAGEIDDVYVVTDVGFSIPLTPEQADIFRGSPDVEDVEEDVEPQVKLPELTPAPFSAQVTDPGVTRVGGPGPTPSGWAWILDTGVDLDHPDLNVETDHCRSMYRFGDRNSQPEDFNGHGTHVAGIIAAKDNTIGTVGVAPGASVVGVKVLRTDGTGRWRKIRRGVDYVAATAMAGDVANMSLGGKVRNGQERRMRRIVEYLAGRGVFVSIAAGNETQDASNTSPSQINGANIFTVSAMDASDTFASFSNFGTGVDCCAPGVNILSLAPDGTTATLSGTSMAAPHVAGILLLNGGTFNTGGTVAGDPDGTPDPIAVR